MTNQCFIHIIGPYLTTISNSWCSSAQPVRHCRIWWTIVSSSLTPARSDSARQIHWRVLFDVHGTLTAIGALLLPDHGSKIICRPNCDNVTLLGKFRRRLKTYFFGIWDHGALVPYRNTLTYLLTYPLLCRLTNTGYTHTFSHGATKIQIKRKVCLQHTKGLII